MAQASGTFRHAVSQRSSDAPAPPGQRALRSAVAAASLCIVLVVVNAVLFLVNQSAQQEVNQRQQAINAGMQINRVDQVLVRALAVQASNANDQMLRDLLAHNGVTFQASPAPDAASTDKK
jgi:hypothetical protein